MTNEYYERTLEIKPLVLADNDIVRRIDDIFSHVYEHKRIDLP